MNLIMNLTARGSGNLPLRVVRLSCHLSLASPIALLCLIAAPARDLTYSDTGGDAANLYNRHGALSMRTASLPRH
jgi:hypothetical protein